MAVLSSTCDKGEGTKVDKNSYHLVIRGTLNRLFAFQSELPLD